MSLSVNIISLLTLLITMSPLIIGLHIILESAGRGSAIQGMLYITGMLFIQGIGYLSRPIFGNLGIRPDLTKDARGQLILDRGRACDIIPDPWNSLYSCPSFHGIFHAFTISYVFGNAIFGNGSFKKNMGTFIVLLLLGVSDMIFRLSKKCVTMLHYGFGILFGFTGAWVWWALMNTIEPKHTYRSYITDKKQCSKIDGKFNCKMEVWAFPSDNPSGMGRKMSEDEIKRLTPKQWMNAMANQALGKPV